MSQLKQNESKLENDKKQTLRILFVSYFFPPQDCIASLRVGKLAKYLERLGHEPWVLTLEEGLFPTAGELQIEIPENQVIRAGLGAILTRLVRQKNQTKKDMPCSVASQRYFSTTGNKKVMRILRSVWKWFSAQFSVVRLPDRALPWIFPAIKAGSRLLDHQQFDAIVSSYGPPSSQIVAAVLTRRFDLPWIADFRDLWTQNHVEKRSGVAQKIERFIELQVLGRATHLVTVSDPLAIQLEGLHKKPVAVIPNGFDEEDYAELSQETLNNKQFTIVYTGFIYPGKRDPSPIFEGVRRLTLESPAIGKSIEVHFLGADAEIIRRLAIAYGIEHQVFVYPRKPHHESMDWQRSADMLLLLEWNDPSARGVYTGKVFEYLGARRPILATGPSGGVIDDLLRDTSSGVLVQNAEQVVQVISEHWQRKVQTGSTKLRNRSGRFLRYTRRYQADMLLDVIQSAMTMHKVKP